MTLVKNIIKKYFGNFAYFYSQLRHRIFIMLILSILIGLLDGFGLAMFLPMLEMVSDEGGAANAEKMGNLSFIIDLIHSFGYSITLGVVLATIFIFFSIKGLFVLLSSYLNVVYQQYFIRRIRERNIYALAEYQYMHFVNSDAGKIQNTMSGEVSRVSNAYRFYLQMMQHSIMILTYAFLAFLSNAEFATLVVVGAILTNLIFKQFYKKTKILSKRHTQSNHGFQGLLIQQVAFFKYLKATGLIKAYADKLMHKVVDIEDSQKKIGIISGIISGVREPILIGIVVIVILIQVNIMGGSLGLIILTILFFYRALQSVMQFQTSYNSFLGLIGSLENLKEFTTNLHAGKQINGKQTIEKFQQSIVLNKVHFRYVQKHILKDINLEIKSNKTLAIVGESGSGKTTLLNIISGLLTPTNGNITIDGIDSTEIDIHTFQKRIGYITQEPVIFDDTIYNNVTFWDSPTEKNKKRFYEALRKANILEFVEDLTEKENSGLGNNGINLSGGQKQRISIARELYKDVDLLFMDEATSALDSDTERVIQENIDCLKGQYTIVIIAHRLSTIKNADRVLLLNQGQIEHLGSYSELMNRSSIFKKMVALQEL